MACSILGVEGRVRAPKWGFNKSDKHQLFTWTCTNQTKSWLMCNYNVLVHEQTTDKHEFTRLTMA
jgi:hypothetical protein